jgi:hypothetical protein
VKTGGTKLEGLKSQNIVTMIAQQPKGKTIEKW